MKELFTFDNVLIVPKFSTISSRSEVDISTNPSALPYMNIPIISANMDTITGHHMALEMQWNGAQACLHRFTSIEENVKMFKHSIIGDQECRSVPLVSIGLGMDELERAEALISVGAYAFVIDVAHAAQMSVVKQADELRTLLGENGSITVGNFATADTVKAFLEHSGDGIVDVVKVGIGPGSACTTRIKTGVGYPQLSAIMEIARLLDKVGISVIADGGMKTPGDIAKALGAGADCVMLGGMLAGTDETPGETMFVDDCGKLVKREDFLAKKIHLDGTVTYIEDEYSNSFPKVKKYRGSASKESYEVQGKNASHRTAEGESFLVPYKGPVKNVLQDIEGGLRSAFSYVGARNLREFQSKVEFVRISDATLTENKAHGKQDR